MQDIWKDLFDANADVVLVGHSHDYERFAPLNANGGLDRTRGIAYRTGENCARKE